MWLSSLNHRENNHSLSNVENINLSLIAAAHINTSTLMLVSAIAIMVYVITNMLREALQIYQQRWKYLFEPNNFVSWCLYVSAIIMVSPIFNNGLVSDVHFSATAIAIFLSWFNLLLFLQRFDQVSVAFYFDTTRKSAFQI